MLGLKLIMVSLILVDGVLVLAEKFFEVFCKLFDLSGGVEGRKGDA